MTSPSSSAPTLRMRQQARERGSRAPSLQTVVAVFVTLLILFFWMQFLVAQEIESLGRGVVEETKKLEKLERDNAALGRTIAEAASQENIKTKAEGLGYVSQSPLYLPLPEPLVQSASEESGRDTSRPGAVTGSETLPLDDSSFLSAVAHSLDIPLETAAGP